LKSEQLADKMVNVCEGVKMIYDIPDIPNIPDIPQRHMGPFQPK
jgi:hypothetical protein